MGEVNPLLREFWMPDYSAKTCHKCDKLFTTFKRKHHCRYCGKIFCSDCTIKHYELPNGAVIPRICQACLNLLNTSMQNNTFNIGDKLLIGTEGNSDTPSITTLEQEDIIPREAEIMDGIEERNRDIKNDAIMDENRDRRIIELLGEMTDCDKDPFEIFANEFLDNRSAKLLSENDMSND